MDLPGILAPQARARPDRRARPHQRARLEHGKRYEDVARRPRRRDRRLLDGQRPAPRVAQRPGGGADRRARARDVPGLRALGAPTRSCSSTSRPPALIERLRAGKVYPTARVPAALNGFFRVENLEALREVALRQVAEDVEAKRLKGDIGVSREDRLMEAATPSRSASGCWPWSRRSRRRSGSSAAPGARRSGSAPSSTCSIVLGASRRRPSASRSTRSPARRRCSAPSARRGAATTSPRSPPASPASARSTYVLIGTPAPRLGAAAGSSEPLTDRLVRRLPGIDVRIVADRIRAARWKPP